MADMAETDPPFEIVRRLERNDPGAREPVIYDQSDIADLGGPIVILGDPGLGKSTLTRTLGRQDGFVYVRASSFVRNAYPERLIPNGECLVIDGLDEIASSSVGGGVEAILAQLSKLDQPRFILSSREADWRGATDRIKIEDDYAAQAVVLHLLPFERADAHLFLSRNFPTVDADKLLGHLADRGLTEIFRNPLTLRLIAEVVAGGEALPETRAELLERACRLLVLEENERHQDAAHVHADPEALLFATGAHSAVQLLCDRAGVHTGPAGKTPDGYVHLSAIARLPHAECADAVLRTRLFEAEGENRFRPIHRLVAEYLGARWIAACFRGGVSARRLFGLFGQGAGVPTSLRALHAWVAHFDDVLAERCIEADPYAVLRYGDAETMPLDTARRLLRALARLSETDPYFRSEDWGQHPASGLMKTELVNEILALIDTPEKHTNLAILLLEALVGSPLAGELAPELRKIMLDPARYYAERMRAAEALHAIGETADPAGTIELLLAQGCEQSRRLAWELLSDLGISSVPIDLVVRCFFAHIGLTVSELDREDDQMRLAHFFEDSIRSLTTEALTGLLDAARDYGGALFESAGHSAKAQTADLVRVAGLEMLRRAPETSPVDIWRRLHWIDHLQGYKRETANALNDWFQSHSEARRAIQAYVLFDAGYDHVRDASFAFYESGLGLYPDADDIVALIEDYGRRSAESPPDPEVLVELALLAPRKDGIAANVLAAAAKIGPGSAEFAAKLKALAEPVVYKWQETQREAAEKRDAEIERIHQSYRDQLSENAGAVEAGSPSLLYVPAQVYLGRNSEFDKQAAPEERLRIFLGPEIAERVLDGFVAAFRRNDLPSASDIAVKHVEGRIFYAELALVCGIAERLRRGFGLDDLPREILEAAFMAWRRTHESQIVGGVDIKPLEAASLADDAAVERFFRASIEPQLAEGISPHVYDLYFLANDGRWNDLAGRLAIEWLRRFSSLPEIVENELLNCAVRHAALADLQQLARDTRGRVHRNYSTMLAWLSLDFLVEFDATYEHLTEAADDDPEFLWFLLNRISNERDSVERRLSVSQRVYLVERFSRAWPKTERPNGSSSGNTNPWDASAAIERSGYALGGDPSPEATAALEHLIAVADFGFRDPLRHALALQLRARRDAEFTAVSLEALSAVARKDLPATVDDMRAYFGDRVEAVQERMHRTNTNMWENFWERDKPRIENFSRNRLIELISGQLSEAIRFEPEMHMPDQKRADIAAICGRIGLPVEIKRQWHPDVWTAPVDQLEARYMRDWHADGRGVYIVLWYGAVVGKLMPRHPEGLPHPATAHAMRDMLFARLPEHLRDVIDVYVVDVSRPDGLA